MPADNNSLQLHRSRRDFLGHALIAGASGALAQVLGFVRIHGWLATAEAATVDLVQDTFNGLAAFIVPGPDDYSVAQGLTTVEPGGIDAGVTDFLISLLDGMASSDPPFSAQIAVILNSLAAVVDPGSSFPQLSFENKVAVFQIMDSNPALATLAGLLPVFVAFLCYSEGFAFQPATRSLIGQPVGWQISHYQGVADGRDEFRGYFANDRTPH